MLRATLANLGLIVGLVAVMAVIHLINDQSGEQLWQFGILPRSAEHWYHIGTAPFIHGSYGHLASNAVGLLVFGGLTVLRSRTLFVAGSVFIIIVGGTLVWGFGRPAIHAGASGWIYGLWALTISIAWFGRKIGNILIAVLVLLVYGGLSYGLLPLKQSISFEMHIAGAVAGVLCGYIYIQILKRRRRQ